MSCLESSPDPRLALCTACHLQSLPVTVLRNGKIEGNALERKS
jgi:hypothetical protein